MCRKNWKNKEKQDTGEIGPSCSQVAVVAKNTERTKSGELGWNSGGSNGMTFLCRERGGRKRKVNGESGLSFWRVSRWLKNNRTSVGRVSRAVVDRNKSFNWFSTPFWFTVENISTYPRLLLFPHCFPSHRKW